MEIFKKANNSRKSAITTKTPKNLKHIQKTLDQKKKNSARKKH